MTLEEINNERKTLQARLQTLKTQREAKVLALQQRKEAFNSDRFLGDLYKIDPATATFFADKMAKDRQLDISANKLYSGTYTPEQKSIVDAKQQNRIRMGEILSTINTLKAKGATETEIKQWQSQYDSLAANDKRLNTMLANLQTPGYTSTEVVPTPLNKNGADGGGGEKKLVVISPSENTGLYLKFLESYDINNYKNASDFPSAEVIKATASNMGYDISATDADVFAKSMVERLKNRSEEKYKAAAEARQTKAANLSEQEKAAEYGLMVSGIESLKTNPTNPTVLNSVLTSLLRLESGAAIGEDEYIKRAKDYMSEKDYEDFINDINDPILNIKDKILSGTAKAEVQKIQAKYIARMDANKIINNATLAVPEEYYKINKERINKSKNPAAGNNPPAGSSAPKGKQGNYDDF